MLGSVLILAYMQYTGEILFRKHTPSKLGAKQRKRKVRHYKVLTPPCLFFQTLFSVMAFNGFKSWQAWNAYVCKYYLLINW